MELYFTRDDEWIAVEGDLATIGITEYAQAQLGAVLFVGLPSIGSLLAKGDPAALIESLKVVSDVFSPVTGIVTESNTALRSAPSLVNTAPEGDGWLFRLTIADPKELLGLLDAESYRTRARLL